MVGGKIVNPYVAGVSGAAIRNVAQKPQEQQIETSIDAMVENTKVTVPEGTNPVIIAGYFLNNVQYGSD